ncbi:MAG: hypothetical protein HYR76_00565 [Ignavibacteria bacterium]|nr:hypothetical protein [Ignavibacteria bacterium]MBI3765722.1 hypothetical protein [Ignavibacteriales bacterium]
MSTFLFGGGDAGGIIIGPHGIKPIPPFDPGLSLQMKAISVLLQAQTNVGNKETQHQLAEIANRLNDLVVGEVQHAVGSMDAGSSIVYQDADGGFTCGSTGKPPIPFPHRGPVRGEIG